MRGVFDDEELAPVQARQDTEFTLGAGTLLLIFFGLVLLCGLCFGLGYSFGRRAPSPTATVIQPQLAAPSALSKPTASEANSAPPDNTATALPGEAPSATAATAPTTGAVPAVQQTTTPAAAPGQPLVHPALVSAPAAPAAQIASVQPALASSTPVMVQIAAVSDVQDADVLVSALRKHGYAVNARRDPADNLIHVRIGPFSTREEALHWRQKLLNDGYNAIVQP